MAKVTIWHNPKCSSSRKALARLREKGVEPDIYLYLDEQPSEAEIAGLLKVLGMNASELLRAREPEADALGLTENGVAETRVLAAMADHPRLIQRPIVISDKGAVVARPAERVDEIL